ncbi:MAG: host attachment protein [Gammaproteobacteria bacterium]|nr:host attachment protein [Gammaproteobacteria bacterium]
MIYARDSKSGPLRELFSMENKTGRRKRGELVSDREGRSFDSSGQGRHAMTEEKSGPKRQAAEAFARRVAQRIAEVLNQGTCRGFALIAAPRFLGDLRDAVETATSTPAYLTIDKDIVGSDLATIEQLIAKSS